MKKTIFDNLKRYAPIARALMLSILFAFAIAIIATSFAEAETVELTFCVIFCIVFSAAFIIPTINLMRGRTTYGRGILSAGLYPEVYTAEVIKRFNTLDTAGWRAGIPSKSQYTTITPDGEACVINLTYFGASPDVLINNNTYPIEMQELDGENIAINLKKFQTKVTPVTDDEVRGLSFDKIKAVQEAHVIKIDETKNNLAIHSIAPLNHTTTTPVLVTTGEDDGTGRLRLTIADILRLKKAWTDAKIPLLGRRLVLCSDHVNDLCALEQKFADQYFNYVTGKIANLHGFEIYEYVEMPHYHVTNKTKLAFGGVVTSSHQQASVAFHLQRVAQAQGGTKAYLSKASDNPQYQRNLLNYRHFDIVLAVKNEGIAAIVSGKAA
jgi:hypothetical protein